MIFFFWLFIGIFEVEDVQPWCRWWWFFKTKHVVECYAKQEKTTGGEWIQWGFAKVFISFFAFCFFVCVQFHLISYTYVVVWILLLVFISFVSGRVDWCKFVYLIVMKFEKWGEFEMFWKHLLDNGMLCMNMGGNSCLLVGSVLCQLTTIRLYGLMLTQQVVNPFFRFYGKK